MAEEKSGLITKINSWLEKFLGGSSENEKGIKATVRKVFRIVIGSVRKFLDDEGLIRATSISYSLIVSFVPIMVVVLLVGAKIIEKEKYFLFAREFIKKHGIPLDPDPYFNIINELLNNANAVTGVGFLVLLFSATSVLRNLEAAINTIWKVKKGRPWVQKISGFLLVLIFGPVLITIGFSMGKNVINYAAAPSITAFADSGDNPVAVGDKALLLHHTSSGWVASDVLSRIDFETRKETILFNSTSNKILTGDEKEALLPKMYQPEKNDIRLRAFTSYAREGSRSWITTDNGCLLKSANGEKTWDIQCYEEENTKLLFRVRFNNITMLSEDTGYITGNSGLIFKTTDGGNTWQPSYIENLRADISGFLAVTNERYFIIGDNFTIYQTDDSGKTWKPARSAEILSGKDKSDLTSIRKSGEHIWVTGDYGLLLQSADGGKSWAKNTLGIMRAEFRDINFSDSNHGVLIGENGFIRVTEDGGQTWQSAETETEENLNHLYFDSRDGSMYVAGEEYVILKSRINSFQKFDTVQKSPFARSLLYALGSFVLPFIFIGIIFFIIYKTLPYTEVINKAAFYGAAVTSLLWVLFLLVFKYYVASFSKGTFAIYGTLAAIPLLLLMVYISAAIMLYGAEIGFFVQHPGLLRVSKSSIKIDDDKRQVWYGLKMLNTLYHNYEKGKGSTKESELVKICNNDFAEFYFILEKFTEMGILESTGKGKYAPVVSAATIRMKDLVADLDPVEYHVPDLDSDPDFRAKIDSYFSKIKNAHSDILQELTFADFLSGRKPFG